MAEAHLARRPGVLHLRRHLAEGDVETLRHEHRIEPVPLLAARRPDNGALDLSDIELIAPIGMGKAERGVERTVPLGRALGAGGLQRIFDPAHADPEVAAVGRFRPVCRVDARIAAQRIDGKARIIGQRDAVGGACRGMRLDAGILDESGAGLFRLGQAEFGCRDDIDPEAIEEFPELLELARIVGRQHQPVATPQCELVHHQASAAF